jgi:prepilin-type N-terminal cleavage/methylation domain-containing protein
MARSTKPQPAGDRQPVRGAFTLVESMATIVVLSILGSIASFIILEAVDGYSDTSTSAQLHTEMSIGLDRAVRELRMIELDSSAGGIAPNITDVTPSSIVWTDSDSDAYKLELSGSDLVMQIDGGAAAVLLSGVGSFQVTTYDEDNTQLAGTLTGAACDPIRRVGLEVTLDRDGTSETLRTKAYIRSTMSPGA